MQDFKKLKVVELRAELSLRNLPQNGKRDELIERLEEYEFEHGDPPLNETGNDDEAIEVEDEIDSTVETKPGSQIVNTIETKPESNTKVNEDEVEKKEQKSVSTSLPESTPTITATVHPIPLPLPILQSESYTPVSHELSEEEKLQARARRFGLETNSATQTPSNIELTIRKLEHSLPVHKYSRKPFHRYKNNSNNSHNHRRVHYSSDASASVNKP